MGAHAKLQNSRSPPSGRKVCEAEREKNCDPAKLGLGQAEQTVCSVCSIVQLFVLQSWRQPVLSRGLEICLNSAIMTDRVPYRPAKSSNQCLRTFLLLKIADIFD